MKLKAKLVYVRDHDLNLDNGKGVQKILQFQTEGGSDVRFTLLVHTNEHAGHPQPTVRKPKEEVTDQELGALLSAGKARIDRENTHQPASQHRDVVVIQGDEGKEFEIEIRPL